MRPEMKYNKGASNPTNVCHGKTGWPGQEHHASHSSVTEEIHNSSPSSLCCCFSSASVVCKETPWINWGVVYKALTVTLPRSAMTIK